MYPSLVLELYKHPSNYGTLKDPTKSISVRNTSCGDAITMEFSYKNGVLKAVAFKGESCAISRASASLLTDAVKGMPATKLQTINVAFMKKLIGIDVAPARLPCLLLPLEALKKSLV